MEFFKPPKKNVLKNEHRTLGLTPDEFDSLLADNLNVIRRAMRKTSELTVTGHDLEHLLELEPASGHGHGIEEHCTESSIEDSAE